jgi:hypothetical protein
MCGRPTFPHICETDGNFQEVNAAPSMPTSASPMHTAATATPTAGPPTGSAAWADASFWQIIDPDVARENPVEDKHRRLIRSHRSSPYDRELKPNANIRDELSASKHVFNTYPLLIFFEPHSKYLATHHHNSSPPRRKISSGSSASISPVTSADSPSS